MKVGYIQVFEHQTLYIQRDPSEAGLTLAQWEALARFADRTSIPYYQLVHNGIRFTQYVGVLQIDSLTIEILPKAGRNGNAQIWQRVLLDMLHISGLLNVHSISKADLKLSYGSILDVYFSFFLDEITQLLHEGLVKGYRTTQANQSTLKGKLLFPDQVLKNNVRQDRFVVSYLTYDTQTLFNSVLYQTLALIYRLSPDIYLKERVRVLLLSFPEQKREPITQQTFERLRFTRKTERYRSAIEIAQLLLLNYHPDLTNGANDVMALLFDMNQVWEKYLYQQLRRSSLSVEYQIDYHDMVLEIRTRNFFNFVYHEPIPTTQTEVYR